MSSSKPAAAGDLVRAVTLMKICRAVLLLSIGAGLPACAIDRSVSVDIDRPDKTFRVIDGDLTVQAGRSIGAGRVIDGDVRLQADSSVRSNLKLTDGRLETEPGVQIGGDVEIHHGSFELRQTRIEGDLDLYCTEGLLLASRIAGVLRVSDKALWYPDCDSPQRITIGPGSEITRLVVESESATVVVQEGALVHDTQRPGQ